MSGFAVLTGDVDFGNIKMVVPGVQRCRSLRAETRADRLEIEYRLSDALTRLSSAARTARAPLSAARQVTGTP